jgi:hypothetical protein
MMRPPRAAAARAPSAHPRRAAAARSPSAHQAAAAAVPQRHGNRGLGHHPIFHSLHHTPKPAPLSCHTACPTSQPARTSCCGLRFLPPHEQASTVLAEMTRIKPWPLPDLSWLGTDGLWKVYLTHWRQWLDRLSGSGRDDRGFDCEREMSAGAAQWAPHFLSRPLSPRYSFRNYVVRGISFISKAGPSAALSIRRR